MTKVHQRLISIKSVIKLIEVGNNSFRKYKGEREIILKEMPIDERKNIVGTIAEEELFLLDYVGAWTQSTCVE
ncbi:hypothetical protein IIM_00066 [Bacillus cereus VD107]|nr:hypothetical protein IIM_00066 [Bacillus cereus VD107]